MLSDYHTVSLMTNFYITFSPTEISVSKFGNSVSDIIDRLNRNEAVEIKYNTTNLKEFTIFFSTLLKRYFKMNNSQDRLQICAMNDIIIDPMEI